MPVHPDRFPSVAAAAARADRTLALVKRWPRQFETRAGALGVVSLLRQGFGGHRPSPSESQIFFALSSGGTSCGFLGIEPLFAWALIAAASGLTLRRTPAPLRSVERGFVAAQLLAIVAELGLSLDPTVRVDQLPASAAELGIVRYSAVSRREGALGEVALFVRADAIAALPPQAGLLHVPFSLSVVLAAATLTLSEWHDARVGDTVVCDEGRLDEPDGTRVLFLSLGENLWRGVLAPDGTLALGGGPRQEVLMSKQSTVPASSLLASSPVILTVELGQLTLTGAEVAALAEGHVLETAFRPGRSSVTVRASGQPWATGDLVEIDGVLGVKLRRLLAVAPEPESAEPADES